ncbi:MAG: phage shock protein A [Flammeovirgaceae bacterium]|jgi:phage shock protein A
MFGWLKRLFRIGVAEANAAIDKIEDPVKMTEQGIKDLKSDLNKSLQALAEVKASAIRSKKELERAKLNAGNYEQKAIALLQKAQAGELDAGEADRLAAKALAKKEQLMSQLHVSEKNSITLDKQVSQMEQNVGRLKSQIGQWENELKTLKARSTVSKASERVNKQLANIDSGGTVALLEKMKDKVMQQEALAESYADMADANVSEDDEIDKALGMGYSTDASAQLGASDALLKLKAKMSGSGASADTSSSANTNSNPAADTNTGGGSSELDKLKNQLKDDGAGA